VLQDRTVSRLIEMQSLEYLLSHAQRHVPEHLLALQVGEVCPGHSGFLKA
jgi:hypothetical protein